MIRFTTTRDGVRLEVSGWHRAHLRHALVATQAGGTWTATDDEGRSFEVVQCARVAAAGVVPVPVDMTEEEVRTGE